MFRSVVENVASYRAMLREFSVIVDEKGRTYTQITEECEPEQILWALSTPTLNRIYNAGKN